MYFTQFTLSLLCTVFYAIKLHNYKNNGFPAYHPRSRLRRGDTFFDTFLGAFWFVSSPSRGVPDHGSSDHLVARDTGPNISGCVPSTHRSPPTADNVSGIRDTKPQLK